MLQIHVCEGTAKMRCMGKKEYNCRTIYSSVGFRFTYLSCMTGAANTCSTCSISVDSDSRRFGLLIMLPIGIGTAAAIVGITIQLVRSTLHES